MTQFLAEMDPFENPVIEFAFHGDLAAIDGAVVSISPGGATLLDGAPQISGTSVFQRIKSGTATAGINYSIRCEATAGADRRVRSAVLPVRAA